MSYPQQERNSNTEFNLGFWLVVAALILIGYQLWRSQPSSLKKGSVAPGLELIRLSDDQRSQETWKGQITILHFWATW